MPCPSIFIRQDSAVRVRGPGFYTCPLNPSVANGPIRLRLGVFVVASGLWTAARVPVAVTCSQYLVLGCSVISSDVVNVIRRLSAMSAVLVVREDSTVSLGVPALSPRMETSMGGTVGVNMPQIQLRTRWVVAERVVARRERRGSFVLVALIRAYNDSVDQQ